MDFFGLLWNLSFLQWQRMEPNWSKWSSSTNSTKWTLQNPLNSMRRSSTFVSNECDSLLTYLFVFSTRRGDRIQPSAVSPDLLRHCHLWRDREGCQDDFDSPDRTHRRHHGSPHRLLHPQWGWDCLLRCQVLYVSENHKDCTGSKSQKGWHSLVLTHDWNVITHNYYLIEKVKKDLV